MIFARLLTRYFDLRLTIITLYRVAVVAEKYTVAIAAIADQEHRDQEHYTAYGTWFPFQEKTSQVQYHKHYVRLQ